MDMSQRKLEILKAVIDDYIVSAVPVGSRTISRKYMPSFSSATIRNEMADLEEMGLLTQPHTSAGRIPSDRAYRLYVDQLMGGEAMLTKEDVAAIRQAVNRRTDEMEEVIRRTASVVSELTHYTALVLAPQLRRMTLRRIQLVGLTRGTALVVIVTDAAVAKDSIIRVPESLDDDDLAEISRRLTQRFAGHALTDVDVNMVPGMSDELRRNRDFFHSLMTVLEDTVVQNDGGEVVMDGAVNIFNYPEYQDAERAKTFLQFLHTRDRLYRMLAGRTKREYSITIGEENAEPDLQDCSLVTATYRVGNRPVGSIGVIGPTRMNYPRVMQVLRLMGRSLGDTFAQALHENREDQ